jgi:mannose-6-phosphate isomerase-like protein (cupin superfamily)
MSVNGRAYKMDVDEGEAIWFAGALMILKAADDQTDGRFAFMDQRVPGDYAVPLHVHHCEDEAWYVLEGQLTFFCGDECFSAGPGAWVFLPKDVPHSFRVGAAGGRLLTFSAPADFASFVRAAGEPAPRLVTPPPQPPDMQKLAAIVAKYGIELIGPPPMQA